MADQFVRSFLRAQESAGMELLDGRALGRNKHDGATPTEVLGDQNVSTAGPDVLAAGLPNLPRLRDSNDWAGSNCTRHVASQSNRRSPDFDGGATGYLRSDDRWMGKELARGVSEPKPFYLP